MALAGGVLTAIHPYMGANVNWYRRARGFSVPELAVKAKCSKRLIYRVEEGSANLSYAMALEIARALRVPVSVIWDHQAAPEIPPDHPAP